MMTELPSAGRRSRSVDATVCCLCEQDALEAHLGLGRPGPGALILGWLGGSQQSWGVGSTAQALLLPCSCWGRSGSK